MAKKKSPRKVSLEDGIARLSNRYAVACCLRSKDWPTDLPSGFRCKRAAKRFSLRLNYHSSSNSFTPVAAAAPTLASKDFRRGPAPGCRKEPVNQSLTITFFLVVYALQDNTTITCVSQLKWLLQQDHIAAQEVVLIEQVPVSLVESAAMT